MANKKTTLSILKEGTRLFKCTTLEANMVKEQIPVEVIEVTATKEVLIDSDNLIRDNVYMGAREFLLEAVQTLLAAEAEEAAAAAEEAAKA